jgi:hypothetical protein
VRGYTQLGAPFAPLAGIVPDLIEVAKGLENSGTLHSVAPSSFSAMKVVEVEVFDEAAFLALNKGGKGGAKRG